ncbi:MAG: TonB-dependent receptor [Pseudomonadota bacterium]|nr:TonB-dependent receptor [Pseudomonadota bacterium]
MRRNQTLALFGIKALAAAVAIAPAAQAQTEQPAARTLEEIVVSARRTEESLQSVPVSVTAFDDKALREMTITSTEDLQYSVPGVHLAGSGGRQNVVYVIRGQSKALSGTTSPAVVSYFAEVPEPVWGSSVPQFDMANVQVLKGPQGTLFGRNTTGGAILYTPQAPTHEFNGYVGGTVGDYDQNRIQGAVNIPLIQDKVALRVAADFNNRDGYTKNIGVGGDLDAVNTNIFRASLLVEPTDYLTNTTIFDHYKSENDGVGVVLKDVFPGNSFPGGTLISLFGLQAAAEEQLALTKQRGPFVNDPSFDQYENNERNSLINRTEVDMGAFQVINIFGYRHTDLNYAINVDAMPTVKAFGFLPVNFIKADKYDQSEQYSNELQFKGTALDDKLDWLVGAFWLKNEPIGYQGNSVAFAVELIGASPAAYTFVTEESQAVFAHVQYDLSDLVVDGLQLELGTRYTEDEVEVCSGVGATPFNNGRNGANEAELSDCENNNTAKIRNSWITDVKSDKTTWSMGLNWQVNDDLFLYAVKRHGYRAGGVNGPTFSGRLIPFQTFEPETVTDHEIGMRADWYLGDTLVRTNVSAFRGEYKSVQAFLSGIQQGANCSPTNNGPGVTPDGDCDPSNDPAGGTLLTNLGNTQVSGVDLELVVAPTDRLSFSVASTIQDSDTKKFSKPADLAPYIPGNEIAFNFFSPKTVLAGVRYELPLDQLAESLVFNVDYYWTDDATKGDGLVLDSYDLTNMRADLNGVGGSAVDLGLFIRNLFDDEYMVASGASGGRLGFETGIYGAPRMWGLEARYSF